VVVRTKVGKRGLEKQDSFILDVIFRFSLQEAKRERKKNKSIYNDITTNMIDLLVFCFSVIQFDVCFGCFLISILSKINLHLSIYRAQTLHTHWALKNTITEEQNTCVL